MTAPAVPQPRPPTLGRAFSRVVHVALIVEPSLGVALDTGARSVHHEGAGELLRRLVRLAGDRSPSCARTSNAWRAALTARAMLALLGRLAEHGELGTKALLATFVQLHTEHWDGLVTFYARGTPERWTSRWPLGS